MPLRPASRLLASGAAGPVCLLLLGGLIAVTVTAASRTVADEFAPRDLPTLDTSEPLTVIGFGSCIRQDRPQAIWPAVVAAKPDVFLLIGDNIYGDTEDMDVMREKYARLAGNPGFARLRRTVPIVATWDDHDYGVKRRRGRVSRQAGQPAGLPRLLRHAGGLAPAGPGGRLPRRHRRSGRQAGPTDHARHAVFPFPAEPADRRPDRRHRDPTPPTRIRPRRSSATPSGPG